MAEALITRTKLLVVREIQEDESGATPPLSGRGGVGIGRETRANSERRDRG